MKAITICQPYAELIMLPESHPDHKRVENRRWFSHHRGPLLIHAGKSRDWLEENDDRPGFDLYGLEIAKLPFGAIVGVVEQVACFWISDIALSQIPENYHWLMRHQHTEGPYCHVYQNVRRFEKPIPYKGAQGYFNVPDEVLAGAMAALAKPPTLNEIHAMGFAPPNGMTPEEYLADVRGEE